jgi:hypothetical protein
MSSEYKPNFSVTTLTASTTLNPFFAGTTIVLSAAAGMTVTLPAATGSGASYEIVVGTNLSSGDYVIEVASAADIMAGTVDVASAIDGVTCPTTSTSDTITMNGSTKGGIIGSRVVLTDMKAGIWSVSGGLVSSSTEATPFSADVS